jgi:hypothetical protein
MTARTIFETNAAKIRELYQAIQDTAKHRDESPEHKQAWEEATHRFNSRYDLLAFPGGLERQEERLKQNHPEAIELAVRFLEADPWFFRSGYIKEDFIQVLKKASLSDDQCSRLRSALLAKIDSGGGREFREYCKLARALQTDEFREELEAKLESPDETVSQRAGWMLEALK